MSIRRIITLRDALDIDGVEARRSRRDRLEQGCLNPLSEGKGIKIRKEEKQRRKDDQRECRDKNHLTLHSITVEVQLVFANVIPCQESDAAGYDQQHDRDIDHRILDITGKGRIQVIVRSQNVKPGVAKGGDGMKHRHPDPVPSVVPAKHRQHDECADQFDQKCSPQDEPGQADDPSDLRR